MSNDTPRVSVVIPTYNRADVLPRAIDSVLGQDYENVELIVVDDGSTDHTDEVMAGYGSAVEYHSLPEHKGANAARNRGIERATGTYISFLDSDDAYPPDNLRRTVSALESVPDTCAGVFTPDETYKDGELWVRRGYDGSVVDIDDLRHANVVGGFSCVAVRRSVFDEIGPLDESLPASQDYDFYLRLTKRYTLRYVGTTHVKRYVGDDNIEFDVERKRRGHERIVEKHGDVISSRRRSRQHSAQGILLARRKRSGEAREQFRRSIAEHRAEFRAYPLYAVACLGDTVLYAAVRTLDRVSGVVSRFRRHR